MNKRCSNGSGIGEVDGVSDMAEIENMAVTKTEKGEDLLGKERVESRMKSRFFLVKEREQLIILNIF